MVKLIAHADAAALQSSELVFPVYYEDTDAAGVVYHAAYLRWAERGRTDMLRAGGCNFQRLTELDVVFVVSQMYAKLHAPAGMDDVILLRTLRFPGIGAKIPFRQFAIRRKDGKILAEMEFIVARLSAASLRPKRYTPELPM